MISFILIDQVILSEGENEIENSESDQHNNSQKEYSSSESIIWTFSKLVVILLDSTSELQSPQHEKNVG